VNAIQARITEPGRESATKSWLRALELTAPISLRPDRVFPALIEELATEFGGTPALLTDTECLTYDELAQRVNQYARWALDQGVGKGDTVCLLMPNRPEYLAIWLGITKVGGVVALLNTNLSGQALAHCINVVAPKWIIAAAELIPGLNRALLEMTEVPMIWVHGATYASYPRIDLDVAVRPGEILRKGERRPVTTEDRALYIYTSGTTGLSKAANVSHGRVVQWAHWFAGMIDTRSTDRMYNCLPMYHSSGGIQAPGAVLVRGGSVVIRDRFSAGQFWSDVVRWDCTLLQYIGELCRYLLHNPPSAHDTAHRIRMACGNGLARDVWRGFQERFQIPRILEFYAATEGSVSLFNAEGEPGAIGRIPSFLSHRSPVVLVKFDAEKELPFRDQRGFCIPCAPNECGEAIGPFLTGASNVGSRFEGYTNNEASEKKILRGVFKPGDAWFRTGDLMQKDERGFFYFVDRIGDTFRWKGENVASSEVAAAICAFPGVRQAIVYGVTIPGADGRAGMAAIVPDGELDLPAFRAHMHSSLPGYACPLFFRIRGEMDMTGTFKYAKSDLMRQGYDPGPAGDRVYFNHPGLEALVPLDGMLYEQIQAGRMRL
jgi:fatty-acyl-CoA synthase